MSLAIIAMFAAAAGQSPTTRPDRIVLPIIDQNSICRETPTAIGCPARADSRYRLPLSDAPAPTSKDRAIAERGEECQLVGARMCTSNGRTVLRQPLDNGE